MKNIAVIGTGIMGSGIAANFLKKGYKVFVFNRSPEKLDHLIQKSAVATRSPKEAASKADIVFEVTANDDSSRSVWEGDEGILAGAKKESVLISSATLSIEWIDKLAGMCKDKGFTFFDMPLTGGRAGAENGRLVLLVGGDERKLMEIEPDLKAISEEITYFGKAGSGMRYKLLLNMLQAIHVAALGEALKIAQDIGLDVKRVGDALSKRPGGTVTNLAWRDYQKIPDPINFSVRWMNKDLSYAKKLAAQLPTPLLDDTLNKFEEAVKKGMSEEDWTAVNRF